MDAELLKQFSAIVGEKYALTSSEDKAPFLHEWRDRYQGRAALVLRPKNTAQISQIMALANETSTPKLFRKGAIRVWLAGKFPLKRAVRSF